MEFDVLEAWLGEMAKVDMESKISRKRNNFLCMLKNHFNIEIVYALKRLISLYYLTHITKRENVCVKVPNHIT